MPTRGKKEKQRLVKAAIWTLLFLVASVMHSMNDLTTWVVVDLVAAAGGIGS
ncbi:hypothetical protein [Streptomyces sp. SID3343]|uniref:hypothetical protein n=1 Tax=Streptomyces sp. SID3343 TaxID=2690260 RepID=UPI00136F5D0E|nr:hypothetical protein [Streptomyces sp. SID3343]MYV99178.1 hypothetical protein [Streptomyces sp. SID3343]